MEIASEQQSKYSIDTRILIDAPIEVVWSVLTRLNDYEKWNPFVPSASGKLEDGSTLDILIRVPGEKSQKYKVKILAFREPLLFTWLGHFIFPGLIDGNHVFELQPQGKGSTLFIQRETFRGLLVPFVWKSYLNTKLRSGFELLNSGLKTHIENQTS